jgi:hypothetical protein
LKASESDELNDLKIDILKALFLARITYHF